MSSFHQWLLAAPTGSSIVLHMGEQADSRCLIQEIADHLNEYDDESDGPWLPALPELIEKVRREPSLRCLLGLDDGMQPPGEDGASDFMKTLAAIGGRGRVVCLAADRAIAKPDAFHAGIGPIRAIRAKCHLILDPDLLDRNCIAHVVGDVFLEWIHSRSRQDTRRF